MQGRRRRGLRGQVHLDRGRHAGPGCVLLSRFGRRRERRLCRWCHQLRRELPDRRLQRQDHLHHCRGHRDVLHRLGHPDRRPDHGESEEDRVIGSFARGLGWPVRCKTHTHNKKKLPKKKKKKKFFFSPKKKKKKKKKKK